jgi:hypothetical protein
MATLKDRSDIFPHIATRIVGGEPEAYVPGTGLSVWEITWLSRVHKGDAYALMRHLRIDPELIAEALDYARAFPDEIETAVREQESRDLDYLRSVLPGIRVVPSEPTPLDEPPA